MHGRHRKKEPRFLVFRGILVLVLTVVLSVSSFATVMANTVSAHVIDGAKSYTFNMNSTDLREILAQAEELGLEALGPLDVAEQVESTTTVNVRRGVSLTVNEAGKQRNLVAYRGDSVQKALEDNNILIKADDVVYPSRNAAVMPGLSVEIKRSCSVTVMADGEAKKFTMTGGVVGDALREAGVALGEKDSVNYEMDEPLFDNMIVKVSRTAKIKITVDDTEREYEVSALTVQAALKKCGVDLGKDDRLNVGRKDRPVEGMHIIVTRVVTEEVQETEEVDYPIEYVTDEEMYEDESEVQTPGVKGEKVVTYKLYYIGGELDSKEAVSEEITKEPVAEVVLVGTKERETVGSDKFYTEGFDGTFIDDAGNTVAYTQKLIGECTAYSVPGGTTSLGWDAVRGVIAVNPSVIPYGTRMYVVSPDGSIVYGYGIAGDTGGALLCGDVFLDLCYNSIAECSIIGRRDMVIYILP